MFEVKFKVKSRVGERKLEKFFFGLGLTITMKGALKSIPENVHWHLKLAKEKGVCEVTMLKSGELIINCKKNRKAEWINDVAQKMQAEFGA